MLRNWCTETLYKIIFLLDDSGRDAGASAQVSQKWNTEMKIGQTTSIYKNQNFCIDLKNTVRYYIFEQSSVNSFYLR